MSGPQAGDTLVAAALKVMLEPDPWQKAAFTRTAVQLWQFGDISQVHDGPLHPSQIPDRPARLCDKVKLVAPGAMPKLGKGGTLASRQAILHSLVHIELAAVDLSWDIIVRFGSDPSYILPKEFFDDFVQVAADEASHFSMLNERLEALGSHYGALPAHDGLWESAQSTAHSLPARLAVEHCVHEARGLDVLPSTVQKFRGNRDAESAALLEDIIYAEEISHCAAGVRWLKYLFQLAHEQQQQSQQELQLQEQQQLQSQLQEQQHEQHELPQGQQQEQQQQQHKQQLEQHDLPSGQQQQPELPVATPHAPAAADAPATGHACSCNGKAGAAQVAGDWVSDARQHSSVESWFQSLVRRHFKGNLKPPFNEPARAKAGFGPEWYLPLVARVDK